MDVEDDLDRLISESVSNAAANDASGLRHRQIPTMAPLGEPKEDLSDEQEDIERQIRDEMAREANAGLIAHHEGTPADYPEVQIARKAEEELVASREQVTQAEIDRKALEENERQIKEAEIQRRAEEEIARRAAALEQELEKKAQAEIERRVAAAQAEAEKRLAAQRQEALREAEIARRAEEEIARREQAMQAEIERKAQEEIARRIKEAEIQRRAEEEIARRAAERRRLEEEEFERRMEEEVKRRVAETEKRLKAQADDRLRGATQVVLATAAGASASADMARGVVAEVAAEANMAAQADPRVQEAKKSLVKGVAMLSSKAAEAADSHAAAAIAKVPSDRRLKVGKFVAEAAVAEAAEKASKNPTLQQAATSAEVMASAARRGAAALEEDAVRLTSKGDAKDALCVLKAALPPKLIDPRRGLKDEEDAIEFEEEDEEGDEEEASEEDEEDFADAGRSYSSEDDQSAEPVGAMREIIITNRNGILSTSAPGVDEEGITSARGEPMPQNYAYERFESFAADETAAGGLTQDCSQHANRVDVKTYATKREEGRCLRPAKEPAPRNSHLSIQLGFFAAKQAIVEFSTTKLSVVDREATPTEENVAGRLSDALFFFEGELMKDPMVLQNVEGLPYEDDTEAAVTPQKLQADARKAVCDATSRWSCGDPLQVWERARGRRMEVAPRTIASPPSNGQGPGVYTTTTGLTTGRFWVGEIETRKPTAASSPFHGGVLYRFSFPEITTQLEVLNGPDLDPIFFHAAIYSVTGTYGSVKVSETLQFDHNGKVFFPHKEATDHLQQRSAVTFIPNEHVAGNMYLIIRAQRLSVEDFDDYVDMYVRPDKWKIHHITPYKQEMQKLALHSDVLEELAWCYVPINPQGKLLQGSFTVDKMYRAGKPLTDGQLPEYFVNDKKRASECKVMPVKITVELKDVTANEVSFVPSGGNGRTDDPSIHPENTVSIFDPDARGARAETHRFLNCCLPILNAGYFTAYQNLLYLRLHSFKLGALTNAGKIPSTHKTFVLHVTLKANDEDSDCTGDEGGIPAFFSGSLGSSALQRSVYSSTVHNVKDVELVDEFKVQLPLVLTYKHHLFFTLFAAQFKKGTAPTKFHRIGCAVMPLLAEKRHLPGDVAAAAEGTCKFSLSVGQNLEMTILLAEQAATLGRGYLAKIQQLPATAFLNNNQPVVKFSTTCRSTVYAVNSVVSRIFEHIPACLPVIRKDDGMFRTCGVLTAAQNALRDDHSCNPSLVLGVDSSPFDVISKSALSLPLAEVMAFFPMIVSFLLSSICSPSSSIDLLTRRRALVALTDVCHKAQQYDLSVKSAAQKRQAAAHRGGNHSTVGPIKTCLSTLLYQFITNDLLYDAGNASAANTRPQVFPVYAAIAEVWTAELKAVFSGATNASLGQNQITKLSELSWFYLDLILRSLYLDGSEPARRKIPVRDRYDKSFYEQLRVLVSLLAERMVSYQGVLLVQRLALFVRNLAHACDRGECISLAAVLVSILDKQQVVYNTQTAVRILLEDDDALHLMWPSAKTTAPQFLLRIVLPPLFAHFSNASRDARIGAVSILHSFLVRSVNSAAVSAPQLERIAAGTLTGAFAELLGAWHSYRALHEQKPSSSSSSATNSIANSNLTQAQSMEERRQLLAVLTWVLFSAPPSVTRTWIRKAGSKTVAGLLLMLADAQHVFRFNAGKDKADIPLPQAANELLSLWDARHATLQNMLAARILSDVALDYVDELRQVHHEKVPVLVFPFFHLVESLLSLQNSTATLQVALAVMYQTVVSIFPELISKKAKMASGVMLLCFRMMTHSCVLVRQIASELFYRIAVGYYDLCGSLIRVKSLTASALVNVAESKARDLQLAGMHVENELVTIRARAQEHPLHQTFTSCSKEYRDRFTDDAVAAVPDDSFSSTAVRSSSGDSGVKYKYTITPQRLTVARILPIEDALAAAAPQRSDANGETNFAMELRSLTVTMSSLFSDVLRLQVDSSMKFNEELGDAFFTVALNFLKQNSVKECLRWLLRLHEFHKKNNSSAEAAMTLVLIAGIAFRATEVFYAVKGQATKGARMPFAIFSHVFWHDYLRLFPELDEIFPLEAACAVSVEWSVVPDEPAFTVEGQIKLLKDAAECFDMATYYEFSITAARTVEQFVRAKKDYKSCAVVFAALQTWSNGIFTAKRTNARYFFVWIRMEQEVGKNASARRPSKKPIQADQQSTNSDDDNHGEEKAPAEGLSAAASSRLPIKRIVKVSDPHISTESFRRYTAELAVSILGGSKFQNLLHVTDELTETQPPALLDTSISQNSFVVGPHGRAPKKGAKMLLRAPLNRCLVTIHEVQPHFDDDPAGGGRRAAPCDKSAAVLKFSSALVIKDSSAGAPTAVASPVPGRKAGATASITVTSERLHICTHTVVRSFPSTTEAVPVALTSVEQLDAFDTAIQYMNKELDALDDALHSASATPNPPEMIHLLLKMLTPRGITPPGLYYKTVVQHMHADPRVIACVREVLSSASAKIKRCEAEGAVTKFPELFAQVIKGLMDVECALVECGVALQEASSSSSFAGEKQQL
jgi:hypothetical protein